MKALLLVAHGSRVDASNDEVRDLLAKLELIASDRYGLFECAFLELAHPSIAEGLHRCANAGATDIVVLPYFLAAGRHVREDIPRIIEETCAELPRISIKIAPYLGAHAHMAKMLLETAAECG